MADRYSPEKVVVVGQGYVGLPLALRAVDAGYDVVGLDTAFYAGQVMREAFPDRVVESPLLGAMVKAGRLGHVLAERELVGQEDRVEQCGLRPLRQILVVADVGQRERRGSRMTP